LDGRIKNWEVEERREGELKGGKIKALDGDGGEDRNQVYIATKP